MPVYNFSVVVDVDVVVVFVVVVVVVVVIVPSLLTPISKLATITNLILSTQ